MTFSFNQLMHCQTGRTSKAFVGMASKTKVTSVELRPDQKLIDPKFDSYKLSLSTLPSYKSKVFDGVYVVEVGGDDFAYEKTKCLTLHNYLVLDQWNKDNLYYVDSKACIRRFHITLETHIEPAKLVFSFGSEMPNTAKKLPPTVFFPSSTLCFACDGFGSIFLLDTGLRNDWNVESWKIIYFDEVQRNPCMVLHAVHRRDEIDGVDVEYLDGIFMKFEEKTAEDGDCVMEVVLEWMTLSKNSSEEEFVVSSSKQFRGKSVPNFVSLSTDCTELHIASNSPFKHISANKSDLSLEIEDSDEEDGNGDVTIQPLYKWKQSNEDVSVIIELPSDAAPYSVAYNLTSKHLSIGIREKRDAEPVIVLSGDLYLPADPEASNWEISEGHLEVTIQKQEEGRTWLTVVDGDDRGELIVDPAEVARIHKRLEHLTSDTTNTDNSSGVLFNAGQLEDCDAYYESTAALSRFDAGVDKFTHVADISSLRWLFNCNIAMNEPPAIVLRHDVDAIVWQPTTPIPNENNRLIWRHVDTFNALGYVHASKTNLKFCACAPDTSYAAFCECQHRVYVYRQPTPLATSLRNRSSGKVIGKVAIQQVATLDGNDDILGFVASNERMYVLTMNDLTILKVSVDEGA